MARRKTPLSRFFFSLRHTPLVAIQMTPDIAEKLKAVFIDFFGVKFLQSEHLGDNGTYYYDFEANDEELEKLDEIFSEILSKRIVKDCDIEINYN